MTALIDFITSPDPGQIVLLGILALLLVGWVSPTRRDGDL